MTGRFLFSKLRLLILAFTYLCRPLFYIFSPISVMCRKLSVLLSYIKFCLCTNQYGKLAYISSTVVFKNPGKLLWGENLSIHDFSYIDASGSIEIGSNVSIAHHCSLVSFEHTWECRSLPIKYNPTVFKGIIIGDDVWLGCGVRVLAGSVIKNRVVVAAGAVVKGTLESGYLYGGVPARKIKEL